MDKDGLELCNNPNDVFDQNTRINSLFDLFKGDVSSEGDDAFGDRPVGGDPFSNVFGSGVTKNDPNPDERKSQQRRESTIIDVDAKKDDE